MAHVGVPRRDPCHKCNLPVFLAERFQVGGKLYHRTCFKCARCGSQLSPGSYYELEVDDEFCCETCPDEEVFSSSTTAINQTLLRTQGVEITDDGLPSTSSTAQIKPVRSSIADRLAFFEKGNANNTTTSAVDPDSTNVIGTKLLEKSVSDEEKTKSLQRIEGNVATETAAAPSKPYKLNNALSNFLNDTIVVGGAEVEESEPTSSSISEEHTNTNGMDTSTSTDCEMEPELPKSPPPPPMQLEQQTNLEPLKRFTSTARMELMTPAAPAAAAAAQSDIETTIKDNKNLTTKDIQFNENSKSTIPRKKKSELNLNLDIEQIDTITTIISPIRIDNRNNNGHHFQSVPETNEAAVVETDLKQQTNLENNLDVSRKNDNYCATKEKTAEMEITAAQTLSSADNKNENKTASLSSVPSESESESQPQSQPEPPLINELDIPVENSVELRNKSEDQLDAMDAEPDSETMERLSVVRARLQQFEVIASSKNNSNSNTNINNIIHNNNNSNNNIHNNNMVESPVRTPVNVNISITDVINNVNSNQINDDNVIISCVNQSDETSTNKMEIENEMIKKRLKNDGEEEEEEEEEEKDAKFVDKTESLEQVPLSLKTIKSASESIHYKEIEKEIENKNQQQQIPEISNKENEEIKVKNAKSPASGKVNAKIYPEDLNPFKSDNDDDDNDDDDDEKMNDSVVLRNCKITPKKSNIVKSSNSNPFDSSDDEIELEKSENSVTTPNSSASGKVKPPRPPPPRISRNPFSEEIDDDTNLSRGSSLTSSFTKRTPVPTPRSMLSQSQNPTPEPTPRLSTKTPQANTSYVALQNSSDYYGSANSLSVTPQSLQRSSEIRGSNNSLTSSTGGTIRIRKNRKAPAPPVPPSVKELFPSTETIDSSKTSTPSSSTVGTPKSNRKKRPAPAPPKPARAADVNLVPQITLEHETNVTVPKNLHSYPLQSELDSKLSDEEKALLEGKQQLLEQAQVQDEKCQRAQIQDNEQIDIKNDDSISGSSNRSTRRLIPLDRTLLEDYENFGHSDDYKNQLQQRDDEETNVVYRRILIPTLIETPTHEKNPLLVALGVQSTTVYDRQLEKLKDNKEAKNRNRQSQLSASSGAEDSDPMTLFNKSSHGKWKRRKGPAPALPVPPRKVLQMLPLQEIRHELDIIEVQQQGLEKQGVILEKMIRDRCEGQNGELLGAINSKTEVDGSNGKKDTGTATGTVQNSKEVEDLILQLFELVNEKNELFRRQAELMYLRRQHRLEQEQADLEYEIRVLMAQPERNKTDTDKSREEALIARLVEVVQLRSDVVDCLEMDRLREAEEDLSIKLSLESHTSKRESDSESKTNMGKLSKKERKKQKEAKKLIKSKRMDVDKDADETEIIADKQKLKKKKKKFLF